MYGVLLRFPFYVYYEFNIFLHTFDEIMQRNAMANEAMSDRRSSLDLCRLWRVGPMSGSGGVAKERQRKAKWKS